MKKIVGTIILMLLAIGLFGCKTWHWGDIIIYEIPKGEHADVGMPSIIEGTGLLYRIESDGTSWIYWVGTAAL